MFNGGGRGQARLTDILSAYCVYNPAVGYCQGMAFVAAVPLLLCKLDDEEAFKLLVAFMDCDGPYDMGSLFAPDLPRCHLMLEVLRHLFRLRVPDLYEHFETNGLAPVLYASPWFMTVYAATFPSPTLGPIWDNFLVDGWVYVFRVAWALRSLARPSIMFPGNGAGNGGTRRGWSGEEGEAQGGGQEAQETQETQEALDIDESMMVLRHLPTTVSTAALLAAVEDTPLHRLELERITLVVHGEHTWNSSRAP